MLAPKHWVWRKIHLGIDEKTLEVGAFEFTVSHIGDASVLPDIVGQIPEDQEIANLTADSAIDTCKFQDAIADRAAHAVIPPRKNAKPWKTVTAGDMARNEAPVRGEIPCPTVSVPTRRRACARVRFWLS